MLLQIEERRIDPDITVVDLSGRLALGRESQKIETMVEEFPRRGVFNVVMDLTRVEYIDSAGIGLIALAAGRMKENAGQLVVVAPAGRVLQLLQVTQVNAIVRVCSTVDEAAATFRPTQRPAGA